MDRNLNGWVSLTLMASKEMQAPWSRKAKYTPFLFTGIDFTSVLMMTSLLVLKRPSPAAIRPANKTNVKTAQEKTSVSSELCLGSAFEALEVVSDAWSVPRNKELPRQQKSKFLANHFRKNCPGRSIVSMSRDANKQNFPLNMRSKGDLFLRQPYLLARFGHGAKSTLRIRFCSNSPPQKIRHLVGVC